MIHFTDNERKLINLNAEAKKLSGFGFRNDWSEPEGYKDNAVKKSEFFRDNEDFIFNPKNSNSLDPDLQRLAFSQAFVREFAIHLAPVNLFTARFDDVPLEGTDKLAVRFYPLQSNASQQYSQSTGYNTASNSVTNVRDVLIGGAGPAGSGSNAPANTANGRLYQMLAYDSLTLRRQPNFDPLQLNRMNAARLALDVWQDVVSRVITQANFGAAALTLNGAAFTGENMASLAHQANLAQWPAAAGRSVVLDSTLHSAALADPTYRTTMSYGKNAELRSKAINEAYGFQDIAVVPNLTSYSPAGENLTGWICFKSAVLFATAPIFPTPEVRKQMMGYDIVTDLETGITLEYRRQGNAVLDQSMHIMQCCYGAQIGVASALKRIAQ